MAVDPSALLPDRASRSALCRLLPELADSPAGWAPPAERDKLNQFHAMVQALQRFSSDQPTVLIVEDLHSADVGSLDFLQYLSTNLLKSHLFLICTYRSDELQRAHPLRPVLVKVERNPGVWRLNLDGLNDADMKALIYYALPEQHALRAETVAAICTQAEGNPLLAEELLKNAIEAQHTGPAPLDLPLSIRQAVLQRLAHFSEDERSILIQAAAIGRRFQPGFLAEILEQPIQLILPVLKRALDLQLIIEESNGQIEYAFRHALTRQAVYSELLGVEARPLHAKIAAALESSAHASDLRAELAYHWWQAHDSFKAAHYNEIAGDAAACVHAHADAMTCYERGLETGVPQGEHRADLFVKLAEALHDLGFGERARSAYESALRVYQADGYTEKAAHTCIALARLSFNIGELEKDFEMTARALESVRSMHDSPALFSAHVEMARLYVDSRGDAEKALEHLAEADRFLGLRPAADAIRFFEVGSFVQAILGNPIDALVNIRKAVELAAAAGDFKNVIRCWGNFAGTMSEMGERKLAIEAFERATSIVYAKPVVDLPDAWILMQYAHASLLHGELLKARSLIEQALAANIEMPRFRLLLAHAGISAGLLLEDDDLVRRCSATDLIDFAFHSGELLIVRASIAFAQLFLAQSRRDEALAILHGAIQALRVLPAIEDDDWLFVIVAQHAMPPTYRSPVRSLRASPGFQKPGLRAHISRYSKRTPPSAAATVLKQ